MTERSFHALASYQRQSLIFLSPNPHSENDEANRGEKEGKEKSFHPHLYEASLKSRVATPKR